MNERFAVAKLAVSIAAVLVATLSAWVAVIAWRSSSETARSQLALSQQLSKYSRPVLSGYGVPPRSLTVKPSSARLSATSMSSW